MSHLNKHFAAVLLASAGALGFSGCNDKPADPESPRQAGSTVTTDKGEAGGVAEDTYTATATISAIEPATRRVTLTASDGRTTMFTAGPQVRNFDQLKVGDKVKATFNERLAVFVRRDGADPSVTHATEIARAPKGATPGAMVAETYEVVAKVKAIDTAARTATLQMVDGATRTIPVRSDVDLSRYQVGDTVVIRVTSTLSMLVANQ